MINRLVFISRNTRTDTITKTKLKLVPPIKRVGIIHGIFLLFPALHVKKETCCVLEDPIENDTD